MPSRKTATASSGLSSLLLYVLRRHEEGARPRRELNELFNMVEEKVTEKGKGKGTASVRQTEEEEEEESRLSRSAPAPATATIQTPMLFIIEDIAKRLKFGDLFVETSPPLLYARDFRTVCIEFLAVLFLKTLQRLILENARVQRKVPTMDFHLPKSVKVCIDPKVRQWETTPGFREVVSSDALTRHFLRAISRFGDISLPSLENNPSSYTAGMLGEMVMLDIARMHILHDSERMIVNMAFLVRYPNNFFQACFFAGHVYASEEWHPRKQTDAICASSKMRREVERHVAFWGLERTSAHALHYIATETRYVYVLPSKVPLDSHLRNVNECLVRLARTELTSPSERKWSPVHIRIIVRTCAVALILRMFKARVEGISDSNHDRICASILYLAGKNGLPEVFRELASRMGSLQDRTSSLIEEAEQVVLRFAANRDGLPCLYCAQPTAPGTANGGQFCKDRFCNVDCRDKALKQLLRTPSLCMQTGTEFSFKLLGAFTHTRK